MPQRFKRARAQLVELIREKGITNERVLRAIGKVPRHMFLESGLHGRAYEDHALPLMLNQTISQPFTVAYQTSLIDAQPREKVLEIGTGSGYQAAVLAELGARVYSIERHEALLQRTNAILDGLGYRILTRLGDGTKGWSAVGPFDAILVTAGGIEVPQALLEQLREPVEGKPHARLVIPVGGHNGQTMLRITRTGPDSYEEEAFDEFRFVPLVGS